MQLKEQNQFYDKLLRFLNKSFFTNLKTQELYLDLTRNTRKLRFKSIKNIYSTLTEGKADEIIFKKEKNNLINYSGYNHLQFFSKLRKTQRTCWRLIQKLITKIAYYLTNERGLKQLAPSILKAVGFTRRATDKINHKSTFLQFFSEVLNLLMQENSVLQKKIYNILIQRGYISSVDEFYKMSRFQSNSDFMYIKSHKNSEVIKQNSNNFPYFKNSLVSFNSTDKKSRKGLVSTKKLFRRNRASIFQAFNLEDQSEEQKSQTKSESDTIKESQISSDGSSRSSKSDATPQKEESIEKINKVNRNIHQQVEKVIEEFVHHPTFDVFLASLSAEGTPPPTTQSNNKKQKPVIKQIIKNIRLKKYQANQKLLQINEQDLMTGITERKNSQPKVENKKKLMQKSKTINHRTSIATALSHRVQEKVFKEKGITVMEDLIIRNLGELKNKSKESVRKSSRSREPIPEKNIVRHKKRQQTQTIEPNPVPILHNDKHRRSSNFHFLSNAFVFNKQSISNNSHQNYFQGRIRTNQSQDNEPSMPSYSNLGTILSGKKNQGSRRSSAELNQLIEGNLFSNQKLMKYSRFGRESILKVKKRGHRNRNEFNTAILDFAARKYNCYSKQNSIMGLEDNVLNWHTLFTEDNETSSKKEKKSMENKMLPLNKLSKQSYVHYRKYDIFDRRNRRIL